MTLTNLKIIKKTPEFKPKEAGVDIFTQIEENDKDLFDFDLEVEPIIEVIVGRTLE